MRPNILLVVQANIRMLYDPVAAVDPIRERRRLFSDTFGCPSYACLDAALVGHDTEVVVIAVPTSLHGAVLDRVVGAPSVKAVLCEKPRAYEVGVAWKMVVRSVGWLPPSDGPCRLAFRESVRARRMVKVNWS